MDARRLRDGFASSICLLTSAIIAISNACSLYTPLFRFLQS